MKLRRLAIHRLPGIASPGFAIDRFGDGVNVVVGPNASGKTSVLRAVRAALYADELAGESVHVEAGFSATGEGASELTVARIGGTLAWTQDDARAGAPPPLPDHRFVSCYTLHLEDLLASDADTDAEIARRVARDLAGGYDLRAIRQEGGFSVPARIGHREAGELAGADAALRTLQHERRELAREEERLPVLDRERQAAEEAGRKAGLVEHALRLLEARRERLGLERRRAALPRGMDGLTGAEAETLAGLRAERQDAADRLASVETDQRAAARSLAESGLAGRRLDGDSIAEIRLLLDRLRRLEDDAGRERVNGTEAVAARERAVQALGGEPGGQTARLDPETIRAVERALDASRRLTADLSAVAAMLDHLPAPEAADGASPDPNRDPDRLRDARRELLRWRSAVSSHGLRGTGRRAGLVGLVGLVAVAGVGGAALGLLVHPAGFGLLAAAAAAVAGWLLRGRDTGLPQRQEAERRYRALGVEPPASWDAEGVDTRLVEVDDALVAALRLADETRRRADAERKRDGLQADFERERARLAEIAERVNFDPEMLDGSFERWLRLTEQYDRADAALHESRARLCAVEREAGGARTRIASFLMEHGRAPGSGAPGTEENDDEPPAAEVLRQRLERLDERLRRRDEAQRTIDAAQENRDRLTSDIASRNAAIAALFGGAGLASDDEAELHRRLGLLEEWRSLDRRLTEVRGAEELLRGELGGRPDLLGEVEADDEPALLRHRDALGEQSDRARGLAEEITKIRTLVEQASKGRDLEQVRAARQRAADALRERYDEALFADAGAFLLDRIEDEHVHSSRPAVLRRAEDWFARFTRHRFSLEVATDDGKGKESHGAFRAHEMATGERRTLSELSSGTRMQLLLAVRIAFAIEAETGCVPLPFFLDEALTTADPGRYRAAVESLRRLAEEDGRQIFYLTAQPNEAAHWTAAEPNVIDLTGWQRAGRVVSRPSEIELPPAPPEPPSPNGHSPGEYAVLIGVLPVDPWAAPAGIHLLHLVRDDLDLLRRILRAGIDRLGPLTSLLASDEAGLVLSDEEQTALRRRAAGAEAWIEAWREGRGRPADRDALEASEAVTDRFLPDVSALAERLGGDASALLQALGDGEVPRFRTESRLRLESWLAEHGYLADTDPLDRPGLERRVAATLHTHGTPPDTVLDEAARLTRSLTAGLPNQGAGAGRAGGLARVGRARESWPRT